jgi:hypothetical protein
MKNLVKYVFLVMFLIFVMQSCYYDKEEKLYPAKTCDTTNSTYSGTVTPLLSANCYSCHSTAQANNVILDTYAGVYAVAGNGQLWCAVNHDQGCSPMPKGGTKLSDCDLEKIHAWISGGALNN